MDKVVAACVTDVVGVTDVVNASDMHDMIDNANITDVVRGVGCYECYC